MGIVGVGGLPPTHRHSLIGILIFLFIRSLGKISEPYDNPFREKSNIGERKKKFR